MIAFGEVAGGPGGITGPRHESPSRYGPAPERGPAETGGRKKPDGVLGFGQEGPHQVGEQPEALDDGTRLPWQAEKVLDDQVEAFTPKPVERLQHDVRGPVHPSLVHVHGQEPVQEGACADVVRAVCSCITSSVA